jgi:DNA-binding CsgD family transcriptional regulator
MSFPIYDFVESELEKFRKECNFSADEMEYFNLRAKHYTNLQIAIQMNVSEGKVNKLAKSVKTKIKRVL